MVGFGQNFENREDWLFLAYEREVRRNIEPDTDGKDGFRMICKGVEVE